MNKVRIRPVYKRPTESQFKKLWKDAVIALDANILLHVYRYESKSRKNLVDTLTKLRDRLFIPEQAYYEFHENRYKVIDDQFELIQSLERALRTHSTALGALNKTGHSYIEGKSLTRISGKVDDLIASLSEFNRLRDEAKEADDRYELLTELIAEVVGPPFDEVMLEKVQSEYEVRAESSIPPGFKDRGKNSGRDSGDLVLWFQIIEYALQQRKPVIFVTDDRKEDWWLIDSGKKVGPRPELIAEFRDKTQHLIHFYTTERFLSYAEEYLKVDVEPTTLVEAKDVEEGLEKKSVLEGYERTIVSRRVLDALSALASGTSGLTIDMKKYIAATDISQTMKAIKGIASAIPSESELARLIDSRYQSASQLVLAKSIVDKWFGNGGDSMDSEGDFLKDSLAGSVNSYVVKPENPSGGDPELSAGKSGRTKKGSAEKRK